MSITISAKDGVVSVSSTDTHTPIPLTELSPEESAAVHLIFEALGEAVSEAGVHVERRTDKYLSIVAYDVYDFCRLKIGKKVMWMSISVPPEMKRTDDPRFEVGQKKNIRHWKIPLQSLSDISNCKDLIQAAFDFDTKDRKAQEPLPQGLGSPEPQEQKADVEAEISQEETESSEIPERPTLFDQKLISSLNNEAFTAYANDVLEYLSFLSKHPSANEDEYTAFTDMLQFLNEEIDRRKARGQIEKPKAKPKAKPASKKMMTIASVLWGILFVTALLVQTYWFIPIGIIFLLIFAARIKM